MTTKLILAGCGNMGFAMLSGWIGSGKLATSECLVVEPNAELRARAAKLGVTVAESAEAIGPDAHPDIVVLAVKPQVIRDVTASYRRFGDGTTTFVSVAAGTPVATFTEILGSRTPVLRCMPNTPASIGKGMMVTFASPHVSESVKSTIGDLLSASGAVASIDDEAQMDAVTAVSGSGPAYIFHFIECLTAAAKTAGLPEDTAKLLAMQTVYGAACLAAEGGEDPATLRKQVTSPNGTTAAALDILMGENRLEKLIAEAVEAARKRSMELAK